MSHYTATRLTRAQSIQQAKADIRAHLAAYKAGQYSADWAGEEIDRIAAFYAAEQVDRYAAFAKRQIANREAIRSAQNQEA